MSIKADISRLETHLQRTFANPTIRIVANPKKDDMAEVFIGDEFIAPIYRDEDDGEVSYQLQMAILMEDLDLI